MAIAVSDLVSRAGYVLQDEGYVRWTVPELIAWINDGAAATITVKPSARSSFKVISLAEGTFQQIPDDGVRLLDVTRNIKADGVSPGRAIRLVDRQLLDDQNPDWHQARKSSTVKHYTFDDRASSEFYVYPPALVGSKVEILYAQLPPAVTSQTDTLDMSREYVDPLVSYVCYRALSKDSEFANGNVATLHYQAFATALGAATQSSAQSSPNQNSV